MLPAVHRMRSSLEFRAAVRSGRRIGRKTVVLHVRADDGSGLPARVGFVVSKSVGGSVVRNRVKRRLRHALAQRLSAFGPGALVVVRANPAAAEAGERLVADVDSALAALVSGSR